MCGLGRGLRATSDTLIDRRGLAGGHANRAAVPRATGKDALMDKVHQVEPVIRRYQSWQEENRRMAPAVFEALGALGLWAIWKPATLGGLECHPITGLKIFEAMARVEPSVGWSIANQASIDAMGAMLQERGQYEVYADPGRRLYPNAKPGADLRRLR